jgi:hypothetical protein
MSTSSNYVGSGTTLSSSYYLRNFYNRNTGASSSATRSEYSNNELSLADGIALRKAIKRLGSFTYSDEQDTNIRNSVSAFVSTYNNLLSSITDSDDSSLKKIMKQMNSLTSEYSDDLDDIGITVKSDGSLEIRSSLLSTASLSKFESLFSSSSDYMQRTNAYRKRAERRSEALNTTALLEKANLEAAAKSSKNDASVIATLGSSVVSSSSDLTSLEFTGTNVNITT